LVFKKGRIPRPRGARNIKQLVRVPRAKHSEKPLQVLENIEKMFPTQDKIELFARNKPIGWDVWGLDIRESYEETEVTQEEEQDVQDIRLLQESIAKLRLDDI
jgi:N6-adenosine-specific RNA methylase IME4